MDFFTDEDRLSVSAVIKSFLNFLKGLDRSSLSLWPLGLVSAKMIMGLVASLIILRFSEAGVTSVFAVLTCVWSFSVVTVGIGCPRNHTGLRGSALRNSGFTG